MGNHPEARSRDAAPTTAATLFYMKSGATGTTQM